MMLHDREVEFISWITKRIPTLVKGLDYADAPRLSTLFETGGEPFSDSEAQSVAFQIGFDTIEAVHEYADEVLAETIVAFEKEFGPEAVVFTSVFRSVPF